MILGGLLFWFLATLAGFAIPAALGLSVIYAVYSALVRHRDGWRRNPFDWPDLLTPPLVAATWLSVAMFEEALGIGYGKTLANAVVEPMLAGAGWCAAWIVRLVFFSRSTNSRRKVAWIMLAAICAATVALALFMPDLPE